MTSPSEVGLLRLVAQRVAGPHEATPLDVVRRLTALQGQDFPGALTAVALRTAAGTREEVAAALDAGEIVRTWPMRGTLHLVAADDLGWMIGLLGPRVMAGARLRRQQLGITDEDIDRARAIGVEALRGGRRLRRAELLTALADAGVDTAGQRGYHLLWYLAQTGALCLGPVDGGEQRFVLTDEWIPAPRRLDPDEAVHELADRFFRGHGPATVKDLARWAGLRVTEARAGLASARDGLARLEVDGVEHWLDPETPDRLAACRAEARGVFLLPGFDEFVLGYGDRGAVLDPAHADRIVPGGNGMFRPTVVHEGRIVGTWGFTGRGAKRAVRATPLTAWPAGVEQGIAAATLPA
ncbi:winged helix DNA-binding domain-containing protein [Blastococcus jejuensis]|uniref:winged helix DNA-binding domain-containing protein n=1 Tax=Blastococcus jejuensis TaxID=351224 RepID=UPI0031DC4FAE